MSKPDAIKTSKNKYLPILIINAVLVLAVIFRAFLCISVMDEVFNIGQALRSLQGNTFLVENWDYFQTGDSFLIPFIFVFTRITGSTEGIVLFSRIVFIVLQLLMGIFLYKILSRFFDRMSSLFAVVIYSTAVSFLLFYMWYDNWELFFRLIGLFLVFGAVTSIEQKTAGKAYIMVFIAGIAHACMVFAYPTMIVLYVYVLALIFFYRRKQSAKAHNLMALFYILGSALVFAVFMLYVLKIGVRNLFIFNSTMAEAGLSSTGREGFFSLSSMVEKTKALIVENIVFYMFSLVFFAVSILILYVFRKNKRKILMFCSVMLLGCIVLLLMTVFRVDSLNTLMTYLSLYTIPLYFLVRKESDRRRHFKDLIVFLWISSFIAGVVYSMTALDGAIKFSAGTRTGAIVTVLLLFEAIRMSEMKSDRKTVFGILASAMVVMNVFALYSFSFDGIKPLECTARIRTGIYKGIIDLPDNAKRYETVEKDLAEVIKDGDKTIACGPFAMEFYLMTDLKPDAANLWDPNNTELAFQYYKTYYGEPDIIVLHDSAGDITSPEFLEFVDENYEFAKYTDGFIIYHHK
jgi:hypothetical protein